MYVCVYVFVSVCVGGRGDREEVEREKGKEKKLVA